MKSLEKNDFRSGFSLLEMAIVILLIASLTALAMPYYSDYVAESKTATMLANLRLLRKALNDYKADKGQYPPTLANLLDSSGGNPPYLYEIPTDPRPSESQGHQKETINAFGTTYDAANNSTETWGYKPFEDNSQPNASYTLFWYYNFISSWPMADIP
ncbi:MAG: prepilin-type N-terminal cleavage/methylation domain-containing protein [Candidatus Riflebacteria bacterium]|nr:prepilin-type N-terminal cleavage/methylation domain-containing protein [Candidatus Riflebacteria bacterium]